MKVSTHKILRVVAVFAALATLSATASAGPNYVSGHISNVVFNGDDVLIMVNAGLPDECAGASAWMRVPPEYKAMNAFVLGLWMRGDAAQVSVMVYTAGVVGGYCRITQIDPAG
jgi:hypothetical protein